MMNFIKRALASVSMIVGIAAASAQRAPPETATATVRADTPGPTYDRRIFTQFAEHLGNGIYGGLWVGDDRRIPHTRGFRNDVVGALKELGVPAIRWPGGCFADEYHWREGIGPKNKRPVKINTHTGAASPNPTPSARTSSWT